MSYFVPFATGRQGASTAQELIKHGKTVNALVRDKTSLRSKALESLGCNIFEGSLDDESTIEPAIKGVSGIFLHFEPYLHHLGKEPQQAKNVVELAALTKTVSSIVISTALKVGKYEEFSSHDPEYHLASFHKSKKEAEDIVRASDIRYKTYLRPAWLMNNYIEPRWRFHFDKYQSEHTMDVACPLETKYAHFDPADVGKFASAAFLEPERFDGHEIELGNELLTIGDVAGTIEKVTGIKIKIKQRTPENEPELTKKYVYGMWQWFLKEKYFETDPEDLTKYQVPLTTFEEWAQREKGALVEALGGST